MSNAIRTLIKDLDEAAGLQKILISYRKCGCINYKKTVKPDGILFEIEVLQENIILVDTNRNEREIPVAMAIGFEHGKIRQSK